MGRANYSDDCDDNWELIKWRGQVASAIRGKRGQAFLREMLDALDAMPKKRLIADALQVDAPAPLEVCAIGSVGVRRGIDLKALDPENYRSIADAFGIARQLVREIEYWNDEGAPHPETPEQRWQRMRAWTERQLIEREVLTDV